MGRRQNDGANGRLVVARRGGSDAPYLRGLVGLAALAAAVSAANDENAGDTPALQVKTTNRHVLTR